MSSSAEAPTTRAPSSAGESTPQARQARHGWTRGWTLWWTLGAPLLLALWFWWRQALVGFHPTDDGFILAQSWRLLLGETIHVDFTSPRPLGSAFLHLPDVLSPWYTLAISRLLVVLQLLWIAAATVSLVSWRTGLGPAMRFALMAFAFILNVNTWPVMAWHTFDGVFLGITAVWLVMRADLADESNQAMRQAAWAGAWLLAGAAPLVKQGFVLAPLLVLGMLLITRQWAGLRWAPFSVLPLLGYLTAARWQVDAIRQQMYGGTSSEVLYPLEVLLQVGTSPFGIATALAALLAVGAVLLAQSVRHGEPLRALAVALLVVPTLIRGSDEGFAMYASPIPGQSVVIWPYLATLSALLVSPVLWGSWRRWAATMAILALGFAVSASWGVPNPGIVAGSILTAAIAAAILPRGARWPRTHSDEAGAVPWGLAAVPTALVTLVSIVSAVLVVQARDENVYRQGPRGQVTQRVDIPALRGITMSPSTAAYVEQVAQCLATAGAPRGAIMPDGPGLYPLFRLRPVFDVDWWIPAELPADVAERNARAIAALGDSAGWIVLRQGFDLRELSSLEPAEVTAPGPSPLAVPGFSEEEFSQLRGEPVSCGALTGVYRPLG